MAGLSTAIIFQRTLEYHCESMPVMKVCISIYICGCGSGLKLLITPILAGLLENNPDMMMEFDMFFSTISKIAQMKVCACH